MRQVEGFAFCAGKETVELGITNVIYVVPGLVDIITAIRFFSGSSS